MAQFTLVGSPEPFLHVSMRRGDKIFAKVMQWLCLKIL